MTLSISRAGSVSNKPFAGTSPLLWSFAARCRDGDKGLESWQQQTAAIASISGVRDHPDINILTCLDDPY